MMQLRRYTTLLTLLALLLTGILVTAQDDSAADAEATEEAEIAYIRSQTGYNIPVLKSDTWTQETDGSTTRFVNDELNAVIQMTAVDTLDIEAAVASTLAAQYEGDLPDEPLYTSRVLLDGTWLHEIYQVDDVTLSALGLLRSNTSYVLTFIETNPDANIYQTVIRTPIPDGEDAAASDVTLDPAASVEVALAEILDAETATQDEDTQEALSLDSGVWQQRIFTDDDDSTITVDAFQFGRNTYLTLTQGDLAPELTAEAADAFNTVLLGFFVTPQTTEFLWLGLIVSFAIFGVLIFSYYWRYRNAEQDMALIEQLANDE